MWHTATSVVRSNRKEDGDRNEDDTSHVGPKVNWDSARHEQRRRQQFPSKQDRESATQFSFFNLDGDHPMCHTCTSLNSADLIATEGIMHQAEARALRHQHDSAHGCPLCTALWKGLLKYLDEEYANRSWKQSMSFLDVGFEEWDVLYDKMERLQILKKEPVRLFLNPLCFDRLNTGCTIPYQLREISAWSASTDILDRIELHYDRYQQEYSYHTPALISSLSALWGNIKTPEGSWLERALATARILPKTSWCKSISNTITLCMAITIRLN